MSLNPNHHRLSSHRLSSAVGSAFVLVAILSAGCGTSSVPAPLAAGATAAPLTEDLPDCAAADGKILPPLNFDRYHLAEGASARDRLFLAILRDDKDGLSALLTAGADVNTTRVRNYGLANDGKLTFNDDADGDPVSLLHWAANLSYSGETIRLLIARGADIHARDRVGRTPLMEAAANAHLSLDGLQALLDAGADVHARDREQRDPMMFLASANSSTHDVLCLLSQKLTLLKKAGADINENVTYTPLMLALTNHNLAEAKLIRALGGDLHARAAADGGTALHCLARAADDSIESVRWLLSRGIDLHVRDNGNKTALDLFKENLSEGRCDQRDSSRPQTNLCEPGITAIIKAIERHHRR